MNITFVITKIKFICVTITNNVQKPNQKKKKLRKKTSNK